MPSKSSGFTLWHSAGQKKTDVVEQQQTPMHDRIDAALTQIETDHQVRILYACESGSRAWGFASTDSDYDVRFIYVHPRDWYLSVFEGRDVIELPIDSVLDVNGWDLRKRLQLLEQSNPTLLEWIQSPIVYREAKAEMDAFRQLSQPWFSSQRGFHHYVSMAKRNFREYLRGDQVRLKKYFYVLRPLLCCRWIEQGRGVPPIEFHALVQTLIHDPNLLQAIDQLLQQKMSGIESDVGPRIPAISDWIEAELVRFDTTPIVQPSDKPPAATLDQYFRSVVNA